MPATARHFTTIWQPQTLFWGTRDWVSKSKDFEIAFLCGFSTKMGICKRHGWIGGMYNTIGSYIIYVNDSWIIMLSGNTCHSVAIYICVIWYVGVNSRQFSTYRYVNISYNAVNAFYFFQQIIFLKGPHYFMLEVRVASQHQEVASLLIALGWESDEIADPWKKVFAKEYGTMTFGCECFTRAEKTHVWSWDYRPVGFCCTNTRGKNSNSQNQCQRADMLIFM